MHLNVYYFESGLNKATMTNLTLTQPHNHSISQLWLVEAPVFGMEATATPCSIRNYDRGIGLS